MTSGLLLPIACELYAHPEPDDCRRTFQAGKRGVMLGSLGIEQAIHLGAAGLEPFSHLAFGDVLLPHSGGKLESRYVDRLGSSEG